VPLGFGEGLPEDPVRTLISIHWLKSETPTAFCAATRYRCRPTAAESIATVELAPTVDVIEVPHALPLND
jgi:hypothetical protein